MTRSTSTMSSSLIFKLVFLSLFFSTLLACSFDSDDDDKRIKHSKLWIPILMKYTLGFLYIFFFFIYKILQIYIVYMGTKVEDPDSAHLHHRAMLEQVVGSTFAPETVVYTYKRSFNGFAVKLTKGEAKKIASMEGVVSVFQIETTNFI
ncbi:unnamed protein product [Citrullus colocynthis]|uniref:Inhibitor I9 domain-containing protein n=1 Tax=Citrullus colocynthis TaxID=252529 RepID=A0ABP0YTY8_9ROSI